jgi:hypothetical protein
VICPRLGHQVKDGLTLIGPSLVDRSAPSLHSWMILRGFCGLEDSADVSLAHPVE